MACTSIVVGNPDLCPLTIAWACGVRTQPAGEIFQFGPVIKKTTNSREAPHLEETSS